MENGFYADSQRLQQHGIEIQEEQRQARLLYEQLCLAGNYAAPEEMPYYAALITQAERLLHYFGNMEKTVDSINMELEQLSQKIAVMFEETMAKYQGAR